MKRNLWSCWVFGLVGMLLCVAQIRMQAQTLQWIKTNDLSNGLVSCFGSFGISLLAGFTSQGIYRSTDNGVNWIQSGLSGHYVLSFALHGAKIYAGTNRGLYRSADNGVTWQVVNTGISGTRVFLYSIVSIGQTIVIGTSGNGVYRSTDDGVTWIPSRQNINNMSIWSLIKHGATLFAGTDMGVYRSSDNGETWSSSNNGMPPIVIYTFTSIGSVIFAGTEDDGVYRSIDNGANWSAINNGLSSLDILSLTSVGTTLFASTSSGGVFQSSDNGGSWSVVNNGLPQLHINTVLANGSAVFAGTAGNGIFRASLPNSASPISKPPLILVNHPNPFTTETTLEYELPSPQRVRLSIVSPLGQTLMTVVDTWQQAGRQSVSMDMSNIPSGVYFARLQAGETSQTTLLRLVR